MHLRPLLLRVHCILPLLLDMCLLLLVRLVGPRNATSAEARTSTRIAQRREDLLRSLAREEVVTEAMAGGVHLVVVMVVLVAVAAATAVTTPIKTKTFASLRTTVVHERPSRAKKPIRTNSDRSPTCLAS